MGDENQYTRPPTTSLPGSGKSKNQFAAQRAKLLFGCYRRGDALDAETYVAAVTLVLAQYPDALIAEVTDPRTGIQTTEKFGSFMPNAGELKLYCDQVAASPRYKAAHQDETAEFKGRTYQGIPVENLRWHGHPLTSRQIQQLLDREAYEQGIRSEPWRPTYDDLRARYGPTFGIGEVAKSIVEAAWKSPSWDQIKQFYEANPERWQALVKPREPGLK